MERFLISELEKWKHKKNRKPMVLMGARQVGKTWLMKTFGERNYKKVAYISFYNNQAMKNIFESDYDIKRILPYLNIEVGFSITPEDTLIIFDEIQNAPKAFESLKYFYEEAPEYHIIVAGSLLGVALHQGVSYPVGKVDLLNLYPLSFREFLYAMDEKSLADALITKDYNLINNFSEKYIYHLKNYYFVGGMPEVVDSFRQNHDYNEVRNIQKNILSQYKGDFGKHASANEITKINMVWDSIPMQLAKENKKFFFGKIKEGARSSEFEIAIQWLTDSGLVHKVNRVTEPKLPLSAYKNFSIYKLFILDIGLLCAMSELDAKTILDENNLFVEFKGALTEQYVLQQLICDTNYTPYYFGTDKATFEQDFLIQKENEIIPIEVKASTNVRSQSLKTFSEKYKPKLSVRFSLLPYCDQTWMINIPLFAVCNL
ncbi:MAG: ATP-binding protein [Treponema sp.]|jgi:predicted AAA+ superfamily ATPase|nr:ATP-binding protein [Treponema sp.]MBQ5632483.1 ATP-binding protein [Treponema sp.]MBQ5878018.1 ATP-binding protein [Treponema sp.]